MRPYVKLLHLLLHCDDNDGDGDGNDVVVGFILLVGSEVAYQLQYPCPSCPHRRLSRARDTGTSVVLHTS